MHNKLLKYAFYDVLRSKVVLGYTLILFLIASGFVYMQSDPSKTIISLLTIVLMIVPLISIILGTTHYYNSREFIELIMAQPIRRRSIFFAQYIGLSVVLALAFIVGIGVPVLLNGFDVATLYLLLNGVLLTFVFTGLAFLSSVFSNDKARGIGISLILWFYFSIVYDGIVLSVLLFFNDYPLEKPVLFLTSLNPIDLSRIIILMNLDISALMGYTGALYSKFFGSFAGIGLSLACMLLWIIVPVWVALRKFERKDF
jgi:Cu-processing system permease protein